MLEPVLRLRPAAALAHEVEPLQLAQRVAGARSSPAHPRAAAGRTAGRAPTAAVSDVVARPGRAGRSRARITFSTVGGTSIARLVVEPPAASSVAARARRRRRASGRAPRGRTGCPRPSLEHALLELGRQRPRADERVRAARARRRRTAPPARARACRCGNSRGRMLAQRPRRVVALRPLREHEQDRGAPRSRPSSRSASCSEVGSAQCRSSSATHDRAVLGQPREQLADDLERAVLQRLGRELGEARARLGLEREPEQRAEVRVDLVGARSPNSCSSRRRSADAHAQLGLVGADAEPLAQQVAERPVRHRLAVGDAPALEPAGVGPSRRSPTARSSARSRLLPIPGSPRDEQDPAAARRQSARALRRRRRARARGRRAAPRRRRARAAARAACSPRTGHARDRLGLALQLELRGSPQSNSARRAPACRVGDEHGRPARRPTAAGRRC